MVQHYVLFFAMFLSPLRNFEGPSSASFYLNGLMVLLTLLKTRSTQKKRRWYYNDKTMIRSPAVLISVQRKIFGMFFSSCLTRWISSLLLRRFVFRMAEASAKRVWLVMNRKGPWEGYRRQAKPVVSFPPSFARTSKRDVWVRDRWINMWTP